MINGNDVYAAIVKVGEHCLKLFPYDLEKHAHTTALVSSELGMGLTVFWGMTNQPLLAIVTGGLSAGMAYQTWNIAKIQATSARKSGCPKTTDEPGVSRWPADAVALRPAHFTRNTTVSELWRNKPE
ncbi:MAG: hypothetical protein PHE27_00405 [Alphaproteobacteria bacterium]|nr:hypothetical protein [Alphaproteobacteria bacterium]